MIAFLPLIVLIFMDKDMDPKNKKIAGGVGAVLAVVATLIGVNFNPPSVEQYTQDMNKCAAEIKAGQPTKDCSPEVAEQAKAIAQDSATVADATKSAANPNGLDVVYWIAPENGAKKAATPHVFHICQGVSPLRGKTVNHGSVTEAYAENATRITKQIPMEQKQCGFAGATAGQGRHPAGSANGIEPAGEASAKRRLFAADVDADERLGRIAALDQQQHARAARPCAPHRPRRSPAPAWSPAGC